MTVTTSLSPDTEFKLKQRAVAAGQELGQFVERLISRELAAPLTLAEAAEPLARAVDAANVSDDEFLALLVAARDASRKRFATIQS